MQQKFHQIAVGGYSTWEACQFCCTIISADCHTRVIEIHKTENCFPFNRSSCLGIWKCTNAATVYMQNWRLKHSICFIKCTYEVQSLINLYVLFILVKTDFGWFAKTCSTLVVLKIVLIQNRFTQKVCN